MVVIKYSTPYVTPTTHGLTYTFLVGAGKEEKEEKKENGE